jgi:hypothetical protein
VRSRAVILTARNELRIVRSVAFVQDRFDNSIITPTSLPSESEPPRSCVSRKPASRLRLGRAAAFATSSSKPKASANIDLSFTSHILLHQTFFCQTITSRTQRPPRHIASLPDRRARGSACTAYLSEQTAPRLRASALLDELSQESDSPTSHDCGVSLTSLLIETFKRASRNLHNISETIAYPPPSSHHISSQHHPLGSHVTITLAAGESDL